MDKLVINIGRSFSNQPRNSAVYVLNGSHYHCCFFHEFFGSFYFCLARMDVNVVLENIRSSSN